MRPSDGRPHKAVAPVLRGHCREIDLVARYGGGEFALLLIETSPENARHVCERIRKAVESHAWEQAHPGLAVSRV